MVEENPDEATIETAWQVAILGINNLFGRATSLLLKQSPEVDKIVLYDDNNVDLARSIRDVNPGSKIVAFKGKENIAKAIRGADIIIIGNGTEALRYCPEKELEQSASKIVHYARMIATNNPNAIVIVAASPINSTVPLVTETLKRCGVEDLNRVMGLASMDAMRARAVLAAHLRVHPNSVYVPVVGGSSPETRVPLYSHTQPHMTVDTKIIKRLTSEVKASDRVLFQGKGEEESLSRAFATVNFLHSITAGLRGQKNVSEIVLSHNKMIPGTDYFSLPVILGADGIEERLALPPLTSYEETLVSHAIRSMAADAKKALRYLTKQEGRNVKQNENMENPVNEEQMKLIDQELEMCQEGSKQANEIKGALNAPTFRARSQQINLTANQSSIASGLPVCKAGSKQTDQANHGSLASNVTTYQARPQQTDYANQASVASRSSTSQAGSKQADGGNQASVASRLPTCQERPKQTDQVNHTSADSRLMLSQARPLQTVQANHGPVASNGTTCEAIPQQTDQANQALAASCLTTCQVSSQQTNQATEALVPLNIPTYQQLQRITSKRSSTHHQSTVEIQTDVDENESFPKESKSKRLSINQEYDRKSQQPQNIIVSKKKHTSALSESSLTTGKDTALESKHSNKKTVEKSNLGKKGQEENKTSLSDSQDVPFPFEMYFDFLHQSKTKAENKVVSLNSSLQQAESGKEGTASRRGTSEKAEDKEKEKQARESALRSSYPYINPYLDINRNPGARKSSTAMTSRAAGSPVRVSKPVQPSILNLKPFQKDLHQFHQPIKSENEIHEKGTSYNLYTIKKKLKEQIDKHYPVGELNNSEEASVEILKAKSRDAERKALEQTSENPGKPSYHQRNPMLTIEETVNPKSDAYFKNNTEPVSSNMQSQYTYIPNFEKPDQFKGYKDFKSGQQGKCLQEEPKMARGYCSRSDLESSGKDRELGLYPIPKLDKSVEPPPRPNKEHRPLTKEREESEGGVSVSRTETGLQTVPKTDKKNEPSVIDYFNNRGPPQTEEDIDENEKMLANPTRKGDDVNHGRNRPAAESADGSDFYPIRKLKDKETIKSEYYYRQRPSTIEDVAPKVDNKHLEDKAKQETTMPIDKMDEAAMYPIPKLEKRYEPKLNNYFNNRHRPLTVQDNYPPALNNNEENLESKLPKNDSNYDSRSFEEIVNRKKSTDSVGEIGVYPIPKLDKPYKPKRNDYFNNRHRPLTIEGNNPPNKNRNEENLEYKIPQGNSNYGSRSFEEVINRRTSVDHNDQTVVYPTPKCDETYKPKQNDYFNNRRRPSTTDSSNGSVQSNNEQYSQYKTPKEASSHGSRNGEAIVYQRTSVPSIDGIAKTTIYSIPKLDKPYEPKINDFLNNRLICSSLECNNPQFQNNNEYNLKYERLRGENNYEARNFEKNTNQGISTQPFVKAGGTSLHPISEADKIKDPNINEYNNNHPKPTTLEKVNSSGEKFAYLKYESENTNSMATDKNVKPNNEVYEIVPGNLSANVTVEYPSVDKTKDQKGQDHFDKLRSLTFEVIIPKTCKTETEIKDSDNNGMIKVKENDIPKDLMPINNCSEQSVLKVKENGNLNLSSNEDNDKDICVKNREVSASFLPNSGEQKTSEGRKTYRAEETSHSFPRTDSESYKGEYITYRVNKTAPGRPTPQVSNNPTPRRPAPQVSNISTPGRPAPQVSNNPAPGRPAPQVSNNPASGRPAPQVSNHPASGRPALQVFKNPASGRLAPQVCNDPAQGWPAPQLSNNPALGRPESQVSNNPAPGRPAASQVSNNSAPVRPASQVVNNSAPGRPAPQVTNNPAPGWPALQVSNNPAPEEKREYPILKAEHTYKANINSDVGQSKSAPPERLPHSTSKISETTNRCEMPEHDPLSKSTNKQSNDQAPGRSIGVSNPKQPRRHYPIPKEERYVTTYRLPKSKPPRLLPNPIKRSPVIQPEKTEYPIPKIDETQKEDLKNNPSKIPKPTNPPELPLPLLSEEVTPEVKSVRCPGRIIYRYPPFNNETYPIPKSVVKDRIINYKPTKQTTRSNTQIFMPTPDIQKEKLNYSVPKVKKTVKSNVVTEVRKEPQMKNTKKTPQTPSLKDENSVHQTTDQKLPNLYKEIHINYRQNSIAPGRIPYRSNKPSADKESIYQIANSENGKEDNDYITYRPHGVVPRRSVGRIRQSRGEEDKRADLPTRETWKAVSERHPQAADPGKSYRLAKHELRRSGRATPIQNILHQPFGNTKQRFPIKDNMFCRSHLTASGPLFGKSVRNTENLKFKTDINKSNDTKCKNQKQGWWSHKASLSSPAPRVGLGTLLMGRPMSDSEKRKESATLVNIDTIYLNRFHLDTEEPAPSGRRRNQSQKEIQGKGSVFGGAFDLKKVNIKYMLPKSENSLKLPSSKLTDETASKEDTSFEPSTREIYIRNVRSITGKKSVHNDIRKRKLGSSVSMGDENENSENVLSVLNNSQFNSLSSVVQNKNTFSNSNEVSPSTFAEDAPCPKFSFMEDNREYLVNGSPLVITGDGKVVKERDLDTKFSDRQDSSETRKSKEFPIFCDVDLLNNNILKLEAGKMLPSIYDPEKVGVERSGATPLPAADVTSRHSLFEHTVYSSNSFSRTKGHTRSLTPTCFSLLPQENSNITGRSRSQDQLFQSSNHTGLQTVQYHAVNSLKSSGEKSNVVIGVKRTYIEESSFSDPTDPNVIKLRTKHDKNDKPKMISHGLKKQKETTVYISSPLATRNDMSKPTDSMLEVPLRIPPAFEGLEITINPEDNAPVKLKINDANDNKISFSISRFYRSPKKRSRSEENTNIGQLKPEKCSPLLEDNSDSIDDKLAKLAAEFESILTGDPHKLDTKDKNKVIQTTIFGDDVHKLEQEENKSQITLFKENSTSSSSSNKSEELRDESLNENIKKNIQDVLYVPKQLSKKSEKQSVSEEPEKKRDTGEERNRNQWDVMFKPREITAVKKEDNSLERSAEQSSKTQEVGQRLSVWDYPPRCPPEYLYETEGNEKGFFAKLKGQLFQMFKTFTVDNMSSKSDENKLRKTKDNQSQTGDLPSTGSKKEAGSQFAGKKTVEMSKKPSADMRKGDQDSGSQQ